MSSNRTLRAPSRLQRPLKVMQSLHSTTTRVRQRQISPTRDIGNCHAVRESDVSELRELIGGEKRAREAHHNLVQ